MSDDMIIKVGSAFWYRTDLPPSAETVDWYAGLYPALWDGTYFMRAARNWKSITVTLRDPRSE